ncbi:mechanosensitive ion channel domain-containing protein [Chryseolinea sp. T2]|uniref:mechanosensitive ion channel family protein n=1 Tax=Chryseolinea sp. T2 TaxID=3129255 RepID=UPI003077C87B
METLDKYRELIMTWMMTYGVKILGAIIVFIVGLYIVSWITKMITQGMRKRHFDISLQSFLGSMIGVGLKVLLLVTVAGMLGIQTTSFVAVIGAMGLAVGLALQGSLANFAGGVLILVFKPFKVGDLIESQGQTGVVNEIQIFNTILLTPENKTVILANGAVSNGTIINYSKQGTLRVDITMAVAPDNDFQKVKKVAEDLMLSHPLVLKDPAPSVNIQKIGDGMVTLAIRPFALASNYWDVYFGLHEQLKTVFEKNGVTAPVPARVIINK